MAGSDGSGDVHFQLREKKCTYGRRSVDWYGCSRGSLCGFVTGPGVCETWWLVEMMGGGDGGSSFSVESEE